MLSKIVTITLPIVITTLGLEGDTSIRDNNLIVVIIN